MTTFMKPYIYRKGATYSADCAKCGATAIIHEWTTDNFNGDRDAMASGTLRCAECDGHVDAETFRKGPRMYAGRYSANGFLDCTDWHYDSNKARLAKTLDELYGEES